MPDPPAQQPVGQEIIASLRVSWDQLTSHFGVNSSVAETTLADVVRAYSGPGRYYHTLRHIRQVLDTIESLRGQANDLAALLWAAWFHDVIYDSQASDNEERSAAFAEQALVEMGIPPPVSATAQQLILETKRHQPTTADPDSRLFLDADLAILGAAEDEYNNYAAAIRQEYQWVPEAAYRAGRQQVLRGFLQRPRIYFTDALFAEREERARANLEQEIRSLGH